MKPLAFQSNYASANGHFTLQPTTKGQVSPRQHDNAQAGPSSAPNMFDHLKAFSDCASISLPRELFQQVMDQSEQIQGVSPEDDDEFLCAVLDGKDEGLNYKQILEGLHGVCNM